MTTSAKSRGAIIGGWLLVVTSGLMGLWAYAARSSPSGKLPKWPSASKLQRETTGFTLVMVVHPRCPCTRASVNELAVLMQHAGSRIAAHVVLELPDTASEAWTQSDLVEAAARIPGVAVSFDRGGVEGVAFGAQTSGETFVFDRDGRVVFAGGITGARGHEGDNAGRLAIEALLVSEPGAPGSTPVFGCALSDLSASSNERKGVSP